MRKLKNGIKIDNSFGIVENVLEMKAKKTPWHLRFAPGVLRPIGRLVSKTVSLGISLVQTVRQRLNQWNWRQKTALVTALAITAAGTFAYQYKAQAAWPAVLAVAGGKDWIVKLFVGYAITQGLNAAFDSSILQKTANADTEDWLYDHREHHLTRKENGAWRSDGENYTRTIHAVATADEGPSHDTSGTDSYLLELGYSSDALTKSEVLYQEVTDKANLSGAAITYNVEELVDGEWEKLQYSQGNRSGNLDDYSLYVTYGGYIPEPTAAELQKRLDDFRSNWNDMAPTNNWVPSEMGPLRVGVEIRSTKETFVCNKAVKLWSEFSFNRVAGDTSAGPDELETPGQCSVYATSLSYIAREAGYSGSIVTLVPENEKPFIEYPEPKSYENDYFMPFDLTKIKWDNFKFVSDPVWTGTATRYFKHKKIYQWCLTHNKKRRPGRRGHRSTCRTTIKHEYPVYQNESVVKP